MSLLFILANDKSVKMKEQKIKGLAVKKTPDVEFTVDESLNKYKGPEFTPPKLKEIEKMFGRRQS